KRSKRAAHEDWPWPSCDPVCCGDGLPQHANQSERQDANAGKGFAQSLTYHSRAAVRSNDRADFHLSRRIGDTRRDRCHDDRSQADEENAEINHTFETDARQVSVTPPTDTSSAIPNCYHGYVAESVPVRLRTWLITLPGQHKTDEDTHN